MGYAISKVGGLMVSQRGMYQCPYLKDYKCVESDLDPLGLVRYPISMHYVNSTRSMITMYRRSLE